jgi:hypothetical protein
MKIFQIFSSEISGAFGGGLSGLLRVIWKGLLEIMDAFKCWFVKSRDRQGRTIRSQQYSSGLKEREI